PSENKSKLLEKQLKERISLFLSSYNAYFFEQHSANAVCVKMSHLL
uniref:Uncharacterized protein n=1 Tax=Gopherus evgoodei TaxID=1825980 RepID=A0A8C4W6F1_9SAUR